MVIGPTPPGTGVIAAGDLERRGEVDVADDAGLALALVGGRHAVDADIDDGGAGLDPVALDHLRAADGGDDDIGLPHDAGEIASSGNARW